MNEIMSGFDVFSITVTTVLMIGVVLFLIHSFSKNDGEEIEE